MTGPAALGRFCWQLACIVAMGLVATAACAPAAQTPQPAAKPAAPAAAPPPAAPAAQPAKPAAQPAKPAAQPAAKPAAPAVGLTEEVKAAAKREGEVTFYSATATAGVNKIKEEAEKQLGIKVNIVRLSSSLLFTRVIKEFETNIHAADVVETSLIEHFLEMKQKKMLQPYAPTNQKLFRGQDYYDPESYWHSGSVSMGAINYNKEQVKGDMVPKTWKELTDPKYKDKLVQGHVKASGTTAVLTYHLAKLYGWEYFDGLRKINVMTQQSCDATNILASGERVIALCDHQITAPAKARGLPIETAFPEDGVFVYLRPQAVMAKAPHPNAAKLFIDWVISPPGQSIYAQHAGLASGLDSPEVKYPADFPDMKKLKMFIVGPQEFGAWFPTGRDKFSELFGG